jgi:hypothetical protein
MSYIPYAFSLLGVQYSYWDGTAIPRDDSTPFYAVNAPPPSRALCEMQGICCTGFINLICRRFGIPVPGVDDPTEIFPGGTGAWGKFLQPHLEPFDSNKEYPDGTLLFRPYKDFDDQGHIALVVGGKTLHSYAYVFEPHTSGKVDPGVSHTPVWPTYYMYAAPPSAWLGSLASTQ